MVNLKAFRKDNNLTQIEAADYFSCTQGFISQIERGERPVPDAFFNKVIADNSINRDNLTNVTIINEEQNESIGNEMIPISVLRMMNDERKRFDDERRRFDAQREEFLAQQRMFIETIQKQAELFKKDVVHPESNVECVVASGSGK